MKKIFSVTIAIPAYNEATNIMTLLNSIIDQNIDSKYDLKTIVVVCDGCNDNTAAIARKFKSFDHRVKVVDDNKRLGKATRLNNLYHSIKEDILVIFDADTRLADPSVLNKMITPFADDRVMLVGGNDTPDSPRTLIEKIGKTWVSAWYQMRHRLNGGDTVHNHKGCASAGRVTFLKILNIPKNIISDDDFLYFSCKQMGFKFVFAPGAVVYYKIPSSLHEYMIQTTRFLDLKHKVAKHFGSWVYEEYEVPTINKLRGLSTTFIKHPIFMTLAVLLQLYQRIAKKIYSENYRSGTWQIIRSSK